MNKINWHLVLTVATIAAGGIPKGYDEGGFSASIGLASYQIEYKLEPSLWETNPGGLASRKANINSFGVLGAAAGSLLAIAINDRLGRLRSWRLYSMIWASGILMQIFSSGLFNFLLFARIWGGLGAGGLTVVAPLFLSEIARKERRGLIVTTYMINVLTFLALGFFVNYAADKSMAATRMQYRIVQAAPLIPVAIAFFPSFFIHDTPRWLASQGRMKDSLAALGCLRNMDVNDEQLLVEFRSFEAQMQQKDQSLEDLSLLSIIREICVVPSYRQRFLLSVFMQTVAQWSGGNGITYYIVIIFGYAGLSGNYASLLSSGGYGLVKLVFTVIFAVALIDIIGRRRSMLAGIGFQLSAHVYMAVYMSQPEASKNKTASNAAIASIFIYGLGWSIGLCTIQYLYGTEIFPTRVRSVAYATNMGLHWFFQFAVVRVTPNMLISFHVWVAFVFWGSVCAVGFVVLGLWVPETKGVSLEDMDTLFAGKWYLGWKAKPRLDIGGPYFHDRAFEDKISVTEVRKELI